MKVASLISRRYLPLSEDTGRRLASVPPVHGVITELPAFLTDDGVTRFRNEARMLLQHGQRRDLQLGGTPRRLLTVNHETIVELGRLIPALLESEELLEFLSGLAGTALVPYGDEYESAAVLHLENAGDTHGGHVDSFRYAFGIALDVPGKYDKGGVLEYVPNEEHVRALQTKACRHHRMNPGDAYLMHRTDRNVHRVSPLEQASSRRTMLSLALSTPDERDRPSESSDAMFSPDPLQP